MEVSRRFSVSMNKLKKIKTTTTTTTTTTITTNNNNNNNNNIKKVNL